MWRFFDYESLPPSKRNPIEDFYRKELSESARMLFDNILKDSGKTGDFRHWVAFKRFLKGEAKGERLFELEFSADKRAYRAICRQSDGRRIVILALCYHKQKVYTPANAIESAVKRSRALREGKAGLRERKIENYI